MAPVLGVFCFKNMDKKIFKNKYRIDTARLKSWDYSADGYYFITICTKNNVNYFGRVINKEMHLSELGLMAQKYWQEIPDHFFNVYLDESIIMPNHLHGIVIINKNKITNDEMPFIGFNNNHVRRDEALPRLYDGISPKPGSLPVIIGSFKSITTKSIRRFNLEFYWQARYYDNVIKDETALFNIREYIKNNPKKWESDRNYKKIT